MAEECLAVVEETGTQAVAAKAARATAEVQVEAGERGEKVNAEVGMP